MLYLLRAYENDGNTYEYEYGCIEHALEHFDIEKCNVKLFVYNKGQETLIKEKTINAVH